MSLQYFEEKISFFIKMSFYPYRNKACIHIVHELFIFLLNNAIISLLLMCLEKAEMIFWSRKMV